MESHRVRTVDYHTGGEPFRIVTEIPAFTSKNVAAKRVEAMQDDAVDGLRALLCSEPRGHADMYGGFVTDPDDDGAHLGVLFWHKDGFSTACGHGTIALGAWAVNSGMVPTASDGATDVRIDVPSGRVTARVRTDRDGKVTSVDFVSVASYQLHNDVTVPTRRGAVSAAIGYGGAIYAHVEAASAGLAVTPRDLTKLISLGREIRDHLNGTPFAKHPDDDRLSGIYGVIFFEDEGTDEAGNLLQRNVTIFADGEVDRSPCGSGTASRVAVLFASGALAADQRLIHRSIVDSVFTAVIAEHSMVDGRQQSRRSSAAWRTRPANTCLSWTQTTR
jgi:proline racemase